jgi:hypothetical protein
VPLKATALTTLQALYRECVANGVYVFAHKSGRGTGEPVKDVKNAFHTALEAADITDFTWARPAPHVRVVARHEGRVAPRGCGATRPSRVADGDALRASLAGVLVGRSRVARRTRRAAIGRKGKRRARWSEAASHHGEDCRISKGKWLAAPDAFRNWLQLGPRPAKRHENRRLCRMAALGAARSRLAME